MRAGLFSPAGVTVALLLAMRTASAESEQVTPEPIVARVDWLQEVLSGGATSVALVFLAMVAFAIVIERFMRIRRKNFAPQTLSKAIDHLAAGSGDAAALRAIREDPSVLGQALQAIIERSGDPEAVRRDAADDSLRRRFRTESARSSLLAVVAGLAPLLGLLGTMIGMIEAFKLVELYGDEGGASMLAGSISKALITTALGLVIAIAALVAYHGVRLRTAGLTTRVEDEVDRFMRVAAHRRARPQFADDGGTSDAHLTT